ncbi:Capsular polysaccharide biosynthesis protein [Granulicatella balaenopterae]|uniref:Capsular polysaccharide biosynthesis protein CpsC n=1 Tax=Granulicatella balaenopterae TaxID=137733 RepID=A0A1H9K8F7_9LACT|nr:Wzz/FepE/Etk N-terminal domain-containing protein [Granulicatella balaenopterae]SEQ95352.1 Capsular polysaccharide biosynthesis protein [Granulicatella balaenopterae]
MNNNEVREEVEIDLAEIFQILKNKIGIILIVGIISAVLAGIGTKLFVTPLYQSETSLYVLSDSEKDNLTNSDLAKNTLLTQDYAELIKSRTVMNEVVKANHLEATPDQLAGQINIDVKNGTRVINIKVTDKDPEMAQTLADSVRQEGSEQIEQVMDVAAVKVVDPANLPLRPSSPNVKRNVLAAGVLGCFVVIAFLIVKHLMDDTIKTTDDVEQYLGLSVLGAIPYDEELNKSHKKAHKAVKKAKATKKTSTEPTTARRGKRGTK